MNPDNEIDATFILGAACSLEYNYPLGDRLRFDIINACKSAIAQFGYASENEKSFMSRYYHTWGLDKLKEFEEALRTSGAETIDDFLKNNAVKYGQITKESIAAVMLEKEKAGNLYPDKTTIYQYLVKRLYPNATSLEKKKFAFITFNYDVSLEAFLLNYITKNLSKSERETYEHYLPMVNVLHVHGKITPNKEVWRLGREYSNFRLDEELIRACAENIKIITDSHVGDKEFEAAQDLIFSAKNIFFLGFGYDNDNMKKLNFNEVLLQFKERYGNTKTFQGTTMNLTEIEVENNIRSHLRGFSFEPFNSNIEKFLSNNPVFQSLISS